jgi:hypothetical protein
VSLGPAVLPHLLTMSSYMPRVGLLSLFTFADYW